ncbi:MAG: cobalamin biosynthesis protein [Nitrososphaerota archaeon]|jgi:adenosylcobinamide-phosphate synthase|nr:cobalamin biosynthesis protein [Nitrososphaerota archaeon]
MIFESILIVISAVILDLLVGDPKNKFHPTSWIGSLIAKLVPIIQNKSPRREKFGGIILVIFLTTLVTTLLVFLEVAIQNIAFDFIGIIVSVIVGVILLKTTIAIRGMEKHAMAVMESIERNDLDAARNNLSMIVKRNTKNLDKNHVLSGTLESISENTVDGVTGPLFYFAFFGIPGAFIYRIINTIDSMIGYKTSIFTNVGWFGANCDKILNYLPSRITSLMMVIGAMILGNDWRKSYKIMKRDGKNTESPNAGYPMAALAGALGTRFEKIDHYSVGEGNIELTKSHLRSAIALMKVTSILFCIIFTIPIIIVLSYLGWWINA